MDKKKIVKTTTKATNKVTTTAPKKVMQTTIKKSKPPLEEFTAPLKKSKIFKKKKPKVITFKGYRTGKKVVMNAKGKPAIPLKRKLINKLKGIRYDKDGVEVREDLKSRITKFAKKRGKKSAKKKLKTQLKNWWGSLQGVSKVAVISVGGVGITAAVAVPTVLANTIWKADNYKISTGDEYVSFAKQEKAANGDLIISFNVHNGIDLQGVSKVQKGDYVLRATDEDEKKLKEYTFDSSTSLLTIDKNVIGTHKGDIKITPIYEKIKITAIDIKAPKDVDHVDIGKTLQMNATISTASGKAPFNPNITWKSSNPQFATINDKGVVTGKEVGTTVITAESVDSLNGNVISNEVLLNVTKVDVTGIEIQGIPQSGDLALFKTITLTAKISPEDATNKDVTWSSSDDTIAEVNPTTGVVTGKTEGTATITATSVDNPNIKQDFSLQVVYRYVTSIEVTGSSSVGVDFTTPLTAKIFPEDASEQEVTWSSDRPDIASVDSSGVVTGIAEGTAIIKATSQHGGPSEPYISGTKSITVQNTIPLGNKNGVHYDKIAGTNNDCVISYDNTYTGKLTTLTVSDTEVKGTNVHVVGIKPNGFAECADLTKVVLDADKLGSIGAGAFNDKVTEVEFNGTLSTSSWVLKKDGKPNLYWGPDYREEGSSSNACALTSSQYFSEYTFEKTNEFNFKVAADGKSGYVNFNTGIQSAVSIPSGFFIGVYRYAANYIYNDEAVNLSGVTSIKLPFPARYIGYNVFPTATSLTSIEFIFVKNWKVKTASGGEEELAVDLSNPVEAATYFKNNKDSGNEYWINTYEQEGEYSIQEYGPGTGFEGYAIGSVESVGSRGSLIEAVLPQFKDNEIGFDILWVGKPGEPNFGFKSASNMTKILLPGTITHICESAFENCTKLKDIYFPNLKQYWGTEGGTSPFLYHGWNKGCGAITVHCFDGDIEIPAWSETN